MTDRETLVSYRMCEADETIEDALKMLAAGVTPRSIINRAYYAMFYAVLALFNRFETPHLTSKHATIIGIFNKEFVRTGKIETGYSRMLHRLFDIRQQADYRDFIELSNEDAHKALEQATEFVSTVKRLIDAE